MIKILWIVIGLAIGWFYLSNKKEIKIEPVVVTPSPIEIVKLASPTPADDWLTYVDKEKGFLIKHPKDLKPEMLADGDIVITKWGPTQKEQTEFFDGINLAFRTEPLEDNNLMKTIESKKKMNEEIYGEKNEIKKIIVNGQDGLSLESSGWNFIYLPRPNGWYLEVLNMSQDPGNLGFETLTLKMIETIKITN
jgi:hypothetical protein